MRKRHQYRMLQAAFVFALIGIAFFGSYQGINYSDKRQPQNNVQTESGQSGPSKSFWERTWNDPIATYTLGLLIVTGLLAAVTGGLYVATAALARDSRNASAKALQASTDATNLAREEFVATHRAKIMVQAVTVADPGGTDRPASIDFWIINAGESPAIITAYAIYGYAQGGQTDFQPISREPPMRNPQGLILSPGERILVRGEGPEIQSQWDIYRFDGRMFILGRVEYTGTDKIGRVTGFCREYIRHTADWQAVPDSQHEYAY